jgi:hypothetical protein
LSKVIKFHVEGELSPRTYADPADFKVDSSFVYVKNNAGTTESYIPIFLLSTAVSVEASAPS